MVFLKRYITEDVAIVLQLWWTGKDVPAVNHGSVIEPATKKRGKVIREIARITCQKSDFTYC